ncbi:cytochrome c oxidase subunit II [Bordetella sp. 02P26C-1]|uniref:cytochrome c oxidase subunit II n=1 Tax=Bordetella sp. 02P26C-1 TaxID=2683195 RepID=UPI0019241ADE|nr:cytochrome c oxidase subunit II [Bordetella sp. 02P26C-1]
MSTLDPAGPAAHTIAQVWNVMAWGALAILIFMLILATLACCRRPAAQERPPLRLFLIGGGLVVPGVVLIALLVFGLRAGDARSPIPGGEDVYRVQVRAHQWWWEVAHPDAPGGPRYAINQIHVPAGVPVHISVTAADVIHGFWIPRLSGKIDAIPGRTNTIKVQADEPGVYDGVCAEFCGLHHTSMGMQLIAHSPTELPDALRGLSDTQVRP